MELINYTLKWVWEVMAEILPQYENICKCKRCQYDIVAFAANKLPPFYVVSKQGYVFSKIKLLSQQSRTDVVAAVIKAIETVSKNPHHQD